MIGVAWLAAKQFLGGLSLQTWLIVGAVIAFGLWTWRVYDAGYDAADAMWKAKNLEATIADIQAKLEANDEIRRQAEADAARAEAEAEKQKELLDELRKAPPSCALTPEHVDGVRRIDGAP